MKKIDSTILYNYIINSHHTEILRSFIEKSVKVDEILLYSKMISVISRDAEILYYECIELYKNSICVIDNNEYFVTNFYLNSVYLYNKNTINRRILTHRDILNYKPFFYIE